MQLLDLCPPPLASFGLIAQDEEVQERTGVEDEARAMRHWPAGQSIQCDAQPDGGAAGMSYSVHSAKLLSLSHSISA